MMCSFLFCSCGKIDEVSQIVIDKIASIQDVGLEDGELLVEIEGIYSTLTDSQKEQVNNYADFLLAKDEYKKLLEEYEKKQAEEQAVKEVYLEKERVYYDMLNENLDNCTSYVERAINNTSIKISVDSIVVKYIHTPTNLKENQIPIWTGFYCYVKYALTNKDGNVSYIYVGAQEGYRDNLSEIEEETYVEYYEKATGRDLDLLKKLEEKFGGKIGEIMLRDNDLEYIVKVGENFYAQDETQSADVIFLVDLEDFYKEYPNT